MQYFLFFILYIYLLFSDSTVELDFFFHSAKIDGIITELRVVQDTKVKQRVCPLITLVSFILYIYLF